MSFLKFIRKTFLITLVLMLIGVFFPQKTQAQWIGNDPIHTAVSTGNAVSTSVTAITSIAQLKTLVLDPIARAAMRYALKKLTDQTVNWINSGFKGNPTYVTDPGQFFLDVGDNAASELLSNSTLANLCTPFKAQVRIALVQNYLTPDQENYTCTLDKVKNNYDQFISDFTQGGWEGWFEITQNQQNNPYGAYFAAENELYTQVSSANNKYSTQLAQGKGFLSYEKCQKGKEMTAQQASDFSDYYGTSYKAGDCLPRDKETVTPGSVIETQLEGALGSGVRQFELAKNFDEVVSALVSALFSRVVGGGDSSGKDALLDPVDTLPPGPTSGVPYISLKGDNPMYVQVNTPFKDPGAIAFDAAGNDIAATRSIQDNNGNVVTAIDTTKLGVYTVTYTASAIDPDTGLTVQANPVIRIIRVTNVTQNVDNSDACFTDGFKTLISNWPDVINTVFVPGGFGARIKMNSTINAMDNAILAERAYATSENKQDSITKLEDLILSLDGLKNQIQNSQGGAAGQVLIDRAKKSFNDELQSYIAYPTCGVPAGETTDLPNPTINLPGFTCTSDGNGGMKCTPDGPAGGNGTGTGTGTGTGGTGGGTCGAGDDPNPPPIASDLSNVVIDGYNVDVRSWPVSNSLSLDSVTFPDGNSSTGNFCLNHVMPWPWSVTSSFSQNIPANGWVFVWRGGVWHAATFEYYYGTGSEATCRVMDSVWNNAAISGGFAPVPGQTYGFMLSGIARGPGASGTTQERTNVVMQTWQGAQCTSGGGGGGGGTGTGGGGTGTPPPVGGGTTTTGSPVITSISPTTVDAGSTTLTINGSNLTSTVQFFDLNSGRTTVVGTVNAAGTQVTVLVPSGIIAGPGTVRIYTNSTLFSNSLALQINSTTVAPPDILATVPSTVATAGYWGSLALNPTANNWLVVSQSGTDINGRIMGNDNTPVSAQFVVNTTATPIQSATPKVVWDPNINKYLVVWISYNDVTPATINGRFVNADGTLSGNIFTIFTDAGGFSYLYPNSRLQYDTVNKKFVFVWEYRIPDPGINLITVSEAGVPGPVVNIASGGGIRRWAPSLAVNTAGNQYCVAYDERDLNKVVVRAYNPISGILGPETFINTLGEDTSIVYNSTNNKYMIGWSNVTPTTSSVKILNSCNGTDGSAAFTSNSAGQLQSLSYNSNTNTYASIVQDQNDSGNTYIIMNSNGVLIRKGVAFAGGRTGNYYPIIGANTVDGTFAAITAQTFNPTLFTSGL